MLAGRTDLNKYACPLDQRFLSFVGIDPEELKEQPALPATSRLHVTAEMGPPVGDEHVFRSVDALDEVPKETGKSVPQIALNWLLQTVSAIIIGARNEEQLRQNLQAVGSNLTAKQVSRLDAASATTRIYPSGTKSPIFPTATLRPPAEQEFGCRHGFGD